MRSDGQVNKIVICILAGLVPTIILNAQNPTPDEKWNAYLQATSIGQYHPSFASPYSGPLSLLSHPEAEASLTSTLFLGWQAAGNTQVYFNPELAGGRGFSGTDGIANFPNGEMPRVTAATPKPYIARLYVTQDFGIGQSVNPLTAKRNSLPEAAR
jgi:high affinity Mn2+ porin